MKIIFFQREALSEQNQFTYFFRNSKRASIIFKTVVFWLCGQTYQKEKQGGNVVKVPMKHISSCSHKSPQLHLLCSPCNMSMEVSGRTQLLCTIVNPPQETVAEQAGQVDEPVVNKTNLHEPSLYICFQLALSISTSL